MLESRLWKPSLLERIRSVPLKVARYYSYFDEYALIWCNINQIMHYYCALELPNTKLCGRCRFNAENYYNFIGLLFCLNHLVTMDATPGRDVVQCARICTPNFKYVAIIQYFYTILRANYCHRTQQISGVQNMSCHTYHSAGISEAIIGRTAKGIGLALPIANSKVTLDWSRP